MIAEPLVAVVQDEPKLKVDEEENPWGVQVDGKEVVVLFVI